MKPSSSDNYNPKAVRVGLAFVTLVVLAAIILFFAVDDLAAKAIMFAVAVTALVRAALLVRSIRSMPSDS